MFWGKRADSPETVLLDHEGTIRKLQLAQWDLLRFDIKQGM